MKAPTQNEVFYCEPAPLALEAPPRIWQRFQIVIPAVDEEQANRIAEKISEFCSCDIERLWSVTDDEGTQVLGQAVLERRLVPVIGEVPAEAP